MSEKKKPRALSWGKCKQVMLDWPREGVIGRVREMYELSAENRQFLHARLISHVGARHLLPGLIWGGQGRDYISLVSLFGSILLLAQFDELVEF
jgi:hypothetical protein